MSNIQHSWQVIVGGRPGHRTAMMLPMTSSNFSCVPALQAAHAPDRCTERQRRILQVKFVAFPGPMAAEPPRSWVADLLSRVLGLLSAARR